MNLTVVEQPITEDWSIINNFNCQIGEANRIINLAESQLGQKYSNILQTIKKIEDSIISFQSTFQVVEERSIEDSTNKQLFRKIASLTHPDKCESGEDIFKEAKKALKSNNREKLISILNEAQKNFAEVLEEKRLELQTLINSDRYNMSLDWLSDNDSRQTKAETYYLGVLLHTMQMKQQILDNIRQNNERK